MANFGTSSILLKDIVALLLLLLLSLPSLEAANCTSTCSGGSGCSKDCPAGEGCTCNCASGPVQVCTCTQCSPRTGGPPPTVHIPQTPEEQCSNSPCSAGLTCCATLNGPQCCTSAQPRCNIVSGCQAGIVVENSFQVDPKYLPTDFCMVCANCGQNKTYTACGNAGCCYDGSGGCVGNTC